MKKRHIIIWSFVFLQVCSFALGQTMAIRAGHLIDPADGSITDGQIILISEGKIMEVGGHVQVSDSVQVVDLSGRWIMPGLMDAHTHLTLNFTPNSFDLGTIYLQESTALRALRGMHNARILLEAGFTTVKDIGNDANYAAADIRRAIERSWFVGPTIINSGKIIAPFGGQTANMSPEQGPFWQFEYIDADTPDEVRKAVRQNIYYGAKTIKLVADNSAFFYSEEEIRAAVTEAHRAGLTVTVHVLEGDAAKNVILGGADAIEHGFMLSDELLALMKKKGTVLVGTDFPFEHIKAIFPHDYTLAELLSESIVDRLRRAHKMGVKMAFGTDTVCDLPGKTRADMAMDYLDIWLQAGVPPAKILKCMTTNAAELLRVHGERGAVAAGQWADIIATPQNPLQDIHALKDVCFVMKNGVIIKHIE